MSYSTTDAISDVSKRASNMSDTARSAAASMASDARHAMGSAGEAVRDASQRAGDIAEAAYQAGRRAAATAAGTAQDYPIATFLVGVAAGWLLSSLMRSGHR